MVTPFTVTFVLAKVYGLGIGVPFGSKGFGI